MLLAYISMDNSELKHILKVIVILVTDRLEHLENNWKQVKNRFLPTLKDKMLKNMD
jgi:hypothetical protein